MQVFCTSMCAKYNGQSCNNAAPALFDLDDDDAEETTTTLMETDE